MTQFPTPPITSANFAVPPFPLPRAWDRIPVPPSAPRLLQNLCTSKIWKRVAVGAGGVTSLSRADEQYEAAVAELRSRGNRPRKRSRYHGFVPLWTTTSWDSRVDAMRDGKWDLFEARALIASLPPYSAASDDSSTTPRWVPRKRHNTRWPIDPPKKQTRLLAEYQPLIEFAVPDADAAEAAEKANVSKRAGSKKLRQRSTRRFSRRLTMPAILEEKTEGSAAAQTPAQSTVVAALVSPVKRQVTRHQSKRISTSPMKQFTMTATPTKVSMEPAEHSTPLARRRSTSKAQSPSPVPQHETSPIIFSQPVPAIEREPEHEKKRRVSLFNARRRSSGGGRGHSIGSTEDSAPSDNRRHSFMPMAPAGSLDVSRTRSRRHTLAGPKRGTDLVFRFDIAGLEDASGMEETFPSRQKDGDSPIVVDASANLDIFASERILSPLKAFADGALQTPPSSLAVEQDSERTTQLAPPSMTVEATTWESPDASLPKGSEVGEFIVTDGVQVDQGYPSPESDETPMKSVGVDELADNSSPGQPNLPTIRVESPRSSNYFNDDTVSHDSITVHSPHAPRPRPEQSDEDEAEGAEQTPPSTPEQATEALVLHDAPLQGDAVPDTPTGALSFSRLLARSSVTPPPQRDEAPSAQQDAAVTLHDDSETEMLRKFITRHKADKTAKAAALQAKVGVGPKRRSGSMGSTASETGSPMAASSLLSGVSMPSLSLSSSTVNSTPLRMTGGRRPLGHKDSNISPSPTKKAAKRKHAGNGDNTGPLDLDDQQPIFRSGNEFSPRGKRRRRHRPTTEERVAASQAAAAAVETEVGSGDADEDVTLDDMTGQQEQAGPRRSTRTRQRVTLKPTAASAANAGPGGALGMNALLRLGDDEGAGDATGAKLVVKPQPPAQEQADKELAAMTRVNTRRNKAGAVPPRALLRRQQKEREADPTGYKLRELKGLFDSLEEIRREKGLVNAGVAGEDGAECTAKTTMPKKAKEVRWAEELVRAHGDEPVPASTDGKSAVPEAADVEAKETEPVIEVEASPATELAATTTSPTPAAAPPVATSAKPATAASSKSKLPLSAPSSTALSASAASAATSTLPKPPGAGGRTRASRLQPPKQTGISKPPPPPPKTPLLKTPATRRTTRTTAAAAAAAAAAGVSSKEPVLSAQLLPPSRLGMSVNGTPAPKRRGRIGL